MITGIVGLLILAGDIWAIINIAQAGIDTAKKVLWILLVLLFPFLGLLIWYLAGPKST